MDASVVKKMIRSSKGLEFESQHPHGAHGATWQLTTSLIPVPKDLKPSSALGTHSCGVQTYVQAKHPYT